MQNALGMANDPQAQANDGPPQPSFGVTDFEVRDQSILVKKVNKFGSAGKAGITAGDELIALNGIRVPSLAGVQDADARMTKMDAFFQQHLKTTGVGGTLRVQLVRGGSTMEVPVLLKARKQLALQLDEVSEVLERKIAP